jgi:hypothetical protein
MVVGALLILAASAQAAVDHGPVYGVLPHEGVFYTRYPVYGDTPADSSASSHSYVSHRRYVTDFRLTPHGWVGQQYRFKVRHYHRPLLYPGTYHYQPLW